jgi:DNA helicase-2/ATP-dependent DNA helicase PcrA
VRQQYRFFVVDEYQDISPLQHKLLRLWLGNRRELCVVGDPAQTIYSFAGARASYLTDFASEFGDARIIRVDGSYRSSPPIIAAVNELARHIPHAISLDPLRPSAGRSPQPVVTAYPDDAAEARGVAERIRAELEAGRAPAEIAVLVRTNAQVPALERALGEANVPYRTNGGPTFFNRPEVRAVVAGIHAAVVAGQDAGPLFQTVSNVLRSRGWQQDRPANPGPERDAWAAMDAIMRLADAAPAGTSLAEFNAQLRERAAHQFEPTIDAVTLSTMHAAKGLEWSSVYVSGLREGLVPTASTVGDDEAVGEERRLVYVAITRARDRLQLSYGSAEGRPTRFLAELGNRIQPETPPEGGREPGR